MSTLHQANDTPNRQLAQLAHLASKLHDNSTNAAIWLALNQTLAVFFGHSLFTVLVFSEKTGVTRLYSTNTGLHPLGTRQTPPAINHDQTPPPCRAVWAQQILIEGKVWRGSTREDLKAVFEDWEQLWQAGLGSVMNIPIRLNGTTIGSLNILGEEHSYDEADFMQGILLAQLVAYFVNRVAGETIANK
ncbi:hypothetical protein ACHAPJ_006645 [Fusarium lateritium]